MSGEHRPGRGVHVELGQLQKWVIGLLLGAIVSVATFAGKRILDELDALSIQQTSSAQNQALMQQQLATLIVQMADIPALRQQVAINTGQISRNADDIKELKARTGK